MGTSEGLLWTLLCQGFRNGDAVETTRADYAEARVLWPVILNPGCLKGLSALLPLSGDCLLGSLSYSSADEVETVCY